MTIAVDFDGTIVRHRYPKIGEEIPFATQTLAMLAREGHRLILWTVREGALLDEAVEWCRQRGVEFYAINRDFPEEDATGKGFSRKLKADLFLDDRSFGGLPDWGTIYHRIQMGKALDGEWHRLGLESSRRKTRARGAAPPGVREAQDATAHAPASWVRSLNDPAMRAASGPLGVSARPRTRW